MIVSVIRAIVQLTIVGYVFKIHLFAQQHSCNCRNASDNHFQCRPQCGKSGQRHPKAFLAFVHFHFDEHFDYSFRFGPERRNQVYSIANHSNLRNDCQQFDGGNRSLLQADENKIPRWASTNRRKACARSSTVSSMLKHCSNVRQNRNAADDWFCQNVRHRQSSGNDVRFDFCGSRPCICHQIPNHGRLHAAFGNQPGIGLFVIYSLSPLFQWRVSNHYRLAQKRLMMHENKLFLVISIMEVDCHAYAKKRMIRN